MTRIAVSVLNFDAARRTLECMASLREAGRACAPDCRIEVWLADNGSGARDRLRLETGLASFADVRYAALERNVGFAAGHNQNLSRILAGPPPDFVWLLNNDCVVEPGAPAALVACARNSPHVGIWGATLLEADGKTVQCAGGCRYWSWISAYRQIGRGRRRERLDRLRARHMDYVAGASLFMPADTLIRGLAPPPSRGHRQDTQTGPWLNESFFLYFEELDLAQRLDPALELAWCRGAIILHAGRSGGARTHPASDSAEYHSTLSALTFTLLYFPARLWIMAPVRLLIKSTLHLVTLRWRLLSPLLRAYADFLSPPARR